MNNLGAIGLIRPLEEALGKLSVFEEDFEMNSNQVSIKSRTGFDYKWDLGEVLEHTAELYLRTFI